MLYSQIKHFKCLSRFIASLFTSYTPNYTNINSIAKFSFFVLFLFIFLTTVSITQSNLVCFVIFICAILGENFVENCVIGKRKKVLFCFRVIIYLCFRVIWVTGFCFRKFRIFLCEQFVL